MGMRKRGRAAHGMTCCCGECNADVPGSPRVRSCQLMDDDAFEALSQAPEVVLQAEQQEAVSEAEAQQPEAGLSAAQRDAVLQALPRDTLASAQAAVEALNGADAQVQLGKPRVLHVPAWAPGSGRPAVSASAACDLRNCC